MLMGRRTKTLQVVDQGQNGLQARVGGFWRMMMLLLRKVKYVVSGFLTAAVSVLSAQLHNKSSLHQSLAWTWYQRVSVSAASEAVSESVSLGAARAVLEGRQEAGDDRTSASCPQAHRLGL